MYNASRGRESVIGIVVRSIMEVVSERRKEKAWSAFFLP